MTDQTDAVVEDVAPENEDQAYEDLFAEATKTQPEVEDEIIEETPEPEREEEPEVEDEKGEKSEDSADDADDWRASLSDRAREEYEKLETAALQFEHKDRSANGRITGLSAKLRDARKQLADLQSKVQDKPTSPPTSSALPEFETPEEFAKLLETYPQLASATKAYADAARKADAEARAEQLAAQQGTTTTPSTPEVDDTYREEQISKLSAAYPNFQEFTQSQFFGEFVDQLPPALQQAVQSNNADDVIYVIRDVYTPYYNQHHPQQTATQGVGGTTDNSAGGAASGGPSDDKSIRAQERRERKSKEVAPEIGTGTRQVAAGESAGSEAYESDFARMARTAEKRRLGLL